MIFNGRLIEELAKLNVDVKDSKIREFIKNENGFSLLLLYTSNDKEMIDFIINKSNTINIKSGIINIHTYSSIIPNLNVNSKSNKKLEDSKKEYAFSLMEYIGYCIDLNVDDEYPGVLLIDVREKSKNERPKWLSLKNKKSDEISMILNKVLDIIIDNFASDFNVINEKLSELDTNILELSKNNKNVSTFISKSDISLGYLFDYAKKKYKITQKDIAEKVDMNPKVLSTWVSGSATPQKKYVSRIIDICYNLMVDSFTLDKVLSYYHWDIDEKILLVIKEYFKDEGAYPQIYVDGKTGIEIYRTDSKNYAEFKNVLKSYENDLNN